MNTADRTLSRIKDEITAASSRSAAIPSYGGPQRDAINSVVDGVVRDLCEKIGHLRGKLDDIEQRILEGAAGAKAALTEHVGVCVRIDAEIKHMNDVIDEIAQRDITI
jgi:hypothetical protein